MPTAFTVPGLTQTSTGTTTLGTLINTAASRARLMEVTIGPSTGAAPSEQSAVWAISLFSGSSGTTTAGSPTPSKTDSYSAAALTTTGWKHTAEPGTYTDLYQIPLHMRASFRWVASPGMEFIAAVSTTNGIGFRQISQTAAFAGIATFQFLE